jgi:enterochelin esterase-like enzyme
VPITLRRRTLLTAASTLVATPSGAPLATSLAGLTGIDATSTVAAASAPGSVTVVTGTFRSAYRKDARTGWRLALPPGVDPDVPRGPDGHRLPVYLVLHGRGGDASVLAGAGYEAALTDVVRRVGRPVALAAIDGGDRYWHARRAGDDVSLAVAREFLPLLARRGLATAPSDRVALGGLSMGGYGGLLLAQSWGPRRVAAVSVMSPALWVRPGDSAPGAFDSRADFVRHDVFARRAALTRIPVRIDCGRSDPFYRATVTFERGLAPRATRGFDRGGHTEDYWRAHAARQLEFVARHLTDRL